MADACIKCVEKLALTTQSKNLISKWLPTFLQDHESAENISVAEYVYLYIHINGDAVHLIYHINSLATTCT